MKKRYLAAIVTVVVVGLLAAWHFKWFALAYYWMVMQQNAGVRDPEGITHVEGDDGSLYLLSEPNLFYRFERR